jgi:hypothetical protein
MGSCATESPAEAKTMAAATAKVTAVQPVRAIISRSP